MFTLSNSRGLMVHVESRSINTAQNRLSTLPTVMDDVDYVCLPFTDKIGHRLQTTFG